MSGNCKKGQIWSFDLLFSSVTFILIIALFILTWSVFSDKANEEKEYIEIYQAAYFASDSLLSTSSDPPGFEYGNATPSSFSLVTESNVIDDLKLDYLNLSNYSLVKKTLGLAKYEFYIDIRDSRDLNKSLFLFGNLTNTTQNIVLDRIVIYNKSLAVFKFGVVK
ncbi:MAG: hypothetical protein AABX38_05010 [Candidatus Micrarchaeota archaeon]